MRNELQHSNPPPPMVHGDPVHPERLYARWIKPGDLVFDIGAHVGERTRVFLTMGCRVVAVEPQQGERQSIPEKATVIAGVVGPTVGRTRFWACPESYMSTTVEDYTEKIQQHNTHSYAPPIEVPMTTLDWMIRRFGMPAFVKIDVEGAEALVLAGLTQPVPALSFEVHNFDRGKADECIALLDALGEYEYGYSQGESFQMDAWPPDELKMFGDVYATLKS